MPPTNTTATTAIAIASLPYSTIQDVHDAGVTSTVWYKYTGTAADDFITVFNSGASPYAARIRVWMNTGANALFTALGDNRSAQFHPIDGTTYWFEARTTSSTVTPAILTVTAARSPQVSWNVGDLFINNDTPASDISAVGTVELDVAVVLSSVTCTVKHAIFPVVCGDQGDSLNNGYILLENLDTLELEFYDSTVTSIFTTAWPGASTDIVIRANRTQGHYYVLDRGTAPGTLYRYSSTGVIFGTTWALDSGVTLIRGITTNTAGTVAYYSKVGSNQPIQRWDLVLNTAMADFAVGIVGQQILEMQTLADDSILARYSGAIRRFDTTGTVTNTYLYDTVNGNSLRYNPDETDLTHFWLMEQILDTLGNVTHRNYYKTRVSDGVNVITNTGTITSDAISEGNGTSALASPSSCPLIVMRGVGGPVVYGTIVVGKFVDPMNTTQNFRFTISGGLTPSPFDLMMDEEQYFTQVPAGIYSIEETSTVSSNYTPIYLFSNTQSTGKNNVVVLPNEALTVAVLNQQHSQYSGLYKIVPDKRSDTYFDTTGTTGTTVMTTTVGFPWDAQGPLIQDLE